MFPVVSIITIIGIIELRAPDWAPVNLNNINQVHIGIKIDSDTKCLKVVMNWD